MAILEVKNIGKQFESTKVLHDVSFSLEEGSALAIIGSSGSGKTTLLRCLNFLETPDRGSIIVKGETLFDASMPLREQEKGLRTKRLHFGMVFQSFNLFPQYTALENVTLAKKLLAKEQPDFKQNKKEIYAAIEEHGKELLHEMGLADRMAHYPHQLSGGQQQRAAIARSLIYRPALLLADEPTGNLDRRNGKEIVDMLKLSNRNLNQTVLLITHDERVALEADRIVTIEDGQIISDRKNGSDLSQTVPGSLRQQTGSCVSGR